MTQHAPTYSRHTSAHVVQDTWATRANSTKMSAPANPALTMPSVTIRPHFARYRRMRTRALARMATPVACAPTSSNLTHLHKLYRSIIRTIARLVTRKSRALGRTKETVLLTWTSVSVTRAATVQCAQILLQTTCSILMDTPARVLAGIQAERARILCTMRCLFIELSARSTSLAVSDLVKETARLMLMNVSATHATTTHIALIPDQKGHTPLSTFQ